MAICFQDIVVFFTFYLFIHLFLIWMCHFVYFKNVKQLYAIVCETIKYTSVLDHIITASQLCKSDRLLKDKDLTRVLLYDFLIGKGIKGAAQKYKVS